MGHGRHGLQTPTKSQWLGSSAMLSSQFQSASSSGKPRRQALELQSFSWFLGSHALSKASHWECQPYASQALYMSPQATSGCNPANAVHPCAVCAAMKHHFSHLQHAADFWMAQACHKNTGHVWQVLKQKNKFQLIQDLSLSLSHRPVPSANSWPARRA